MFEKLYFLAEREQIKTSRNACDKVIQMSQSGEWSGRIGW